MSRYLQLGKDSKIYLCYKKSINRMICTGEEYFVDEKYKICKKSITFSKSRLHYYS